MHWFIWSRTANNDRFHVENDGPTSVELKLKKIWSNFCLEITIKCFLRWLSYFELNPKCFLWRSCFVHGFCLFQFFQKINLTRSLNLFQGLEREVALFFLKDFLYVWFQKEHWIKFAFSFILQLATFKTLKRD